MLFRNQNPIRPQSSDFWLLPSGGFDQSRAEDDLVLAREGAVVLIDAVSQQYMVGAEIDYVDDLIGASFKINNPGATASCGCGTSFSV